MWIDLIAHIKSILGLKYLSYKNQNIHKNFAIDLVTLFLGPFKFKYVPTDIHGKKSTSHRLLP